MMCMLPPRTVVAQGQVLYTTDFKLMFHVERA